MTLAAVPALVLFMALVLTAALGGLTASGHFPADMRKPRIASGLGPAILWGSIAAMLAVAAAAALIAWRHLPIPTAIIAGGAMLLAAPLVLAPLPDRFVDTRLGLAAFAALGVALILVSTVALD